jgi:hypothetical protein
VVLWDAGLDGADRHQDRVISDAPGRPVDPLRVEETPEGLAHLLPSGRGTAPLDPVAWMVATMRGWRLSTLLEAGVAWSPTGARKRAPGAATADVRDASLLAHQGRAAFTALCRLEPERPNRADESAPGGCAPLSTRAATRG